MEKNTEVFPGKLIITRVNKKRNTLFFHTRKNLPRAYLRFMMLLYRRSSVISTFFYKMEY